MSKINLHEIKNKNFNFKTPQNIHPLERRIVLENYGVIDPLDIEQYIAKDGYFALKKALTLTPKEVIEEIISSNLRGRGGVGFPTGLKWKFTRNNSSKDKYIVCNADEGEPGTFMDKHVLEGDPHKVIEGIIIAGFAIGASKGYLYLRAEYPEAKNILQTAIKQCYDYNILGNNILESDFSFDLELRMGAGAFICGEETSLLESIEGNRGESKNKPPYPANKGLFGKPTSVNNVETLACIPSIILKGSSWFNQIGTEKSKGTKIFSISGKVKKPGIYEVPFGLTMNQLIFELCGGLKNNSKFNFIAVGGPSGGFLFEEHLNTIVDFDSLTPLKAMMGSGGIIVFDQNDCLIDILYLFMKFNREESCGKCTPCREGTKIMTYKLNNFRKGKANLKDIDEMIALGKTMKRSALCGLGQAASIPFFSALTYRKNIFLEHITNTCKICKESGEINE